MKSYEKESVLLVLKVSILPVVVSIGIADTVVKVILMFKSVVFSSAKITASFCVKVDAVSSEGTTGTASMEKSSNRVPAGGSTATNVVSRTGIVDSIGTEVSSAAGILICFGATVTIISRASRGPEERYTLLIVEIEVNVSPSALSVGSDDGIISPAVVASLIEFFSVSTVGWSVRIDVSEARVVDSVLGFTAQTVKVGSPVETESVLGTSVVVAVSSEVVVNSAIVVMGADGISAAGVISSVDQSSVRFAISVLMVETESI
jgi:hypothetical protein